MSEAETGFKAGYEPRNEHPEYACYDKRYRPHKEAFKSLCCELMDGKRDAAKAGEKERFHLPQDAAENKSR